jgi:hypothetical protein
MTEHPVFECASCSDRFLITGKEHVLHRGEEALESKNFHMAFKVVVSEFRCPCGAEFSNGDEESVAAGSALEHGVLGHLSRPPLMMCPLPGHLQ